MSVTLSRSIEPSFSRRIRGSIILFLLLFLAIPALLFTVVNADAPQVTLGWNASTGSNVTGYKVYYGTASGNYAYYVDAGNTTSYAMTGLSAGATYYFAATAYDSSGDQSADLQPGQLYRSIRVGSVGPVRVLHLFHISRERIGRRRCDNGEHKRHHAEWMHLDGNERCILDDDHFGQQRHRKRHCELFGRCQYDHVIEDRDFHHRRRLIQPYPGGRLRPGQSPPSVADADLYYHCFRRARRLHFAGRLRLGQFGGQQDLFHYAEIRLLYQQCDG